MFASWFHVHVLHRLDLAYTVIKDSSSELPICVPDTSDWALSLATADGKSDKLMSHCKMDNVHSPG